MDFVDRAFSKVHSLFFSEHESSQSKSRKANKLNTSKLSKQQQFVPNLIEFSSVESIDSPDAPQSQYQRRLDELRDEIRLLRIAPGKDTDRIACEISYVSVLDAPPYEALSYAWGDARDGTRTIELDGKLFKATINLTEFLKHARHMGWTGFFWIDAVCIDQNHIPERNQQVRRMADIYKKSQRIIIWLGTESEDSGLAFAKINKIYHDYWLPYKLNKKNTSWIKKNITADEAALFGDLDNATHAKQWKAVSNLYGRRWWTRIWVLQEATVPEKGRSQTMLMCGYKTTPLTAALVTNSLCREIHGRQDLPDLGIRPSRRVTNLRQVLMYREERAKALTNLQYLLILSEGFIATDPKDNIYGLLALASDGKAEELTPNYSDDVWKVYSRVTRYLIQSSGCLDILDHALPSYSTRTDQVLPSWVPDYSTTFIQHTLYKRNPVSQIDGTPVFNSSLNTSPSIRFSPDGWSMFVKGFLFDTISAVGTKASNITTASQTDWLRLALKCGPHNPSEPQESQYVTGCTKLEAFCHTLVTDSTYDDDGVVHRGVTWDWTTDEGLSSEEIDLIHESSVQRLIEHELPEDSMDRHVSSTDNSTLASMDSTTTIIAPAHHDQDNEKPQWTGISTESSEVSNEAGSGSLGSSGSHGRAENTINAPKSPWKPTRSPKNCKVLVRRATVGRKLFTTEKGYMGLAPDDIDVGDLVCVFMGGQTPYVVRRARNITRGGSADTANEDARGADKEDGDDQSKDGFTFMGEAYVHGIMDGEAMREVLQKNAIEGREMDELKLR